MTVNEGLRLVAGIVIVASVILAYMVSQYWLLLTAFVGLNLMQSAFTRWCPMMVILKKLGLRQEVVAD
ncbi:MAG: DUF2892 domain-containing protein [Gammaproteobacteria bacterium]|nr:DUF2892 domain-containing protein [Gammaproteobacteria bacterium]